MLTGIHSHPGLKNSTNPTTISLKMLVVVIISFPSLLHLTFTVNQHPS
jgi:hypothetical protein